MRFGPRTTVLKFKHFTTEPNKTPPERKKKKREGKKERKRDGENHKHDFLVYILFRKKIHNIANSCFVASNNFLIQKSQYVSLSRKGHGGNKERKKERKQTLQFFSVHFILEIIS